MAAALPRLCALALPFLAVAACLDVPSHGNRMHLPRKPSQELACSGELEKSKCGVRRTRGTGGL